MAFAYSSFEVDLSSVDSALEFVKVSLAEFGLALPLDAELSLALGAGIDPDGVTVYRPKALMAAFLDRTKNSKVFLSGEGATFRDPDKTIRAWLSEQAQIDTSLSLILPPGAEVVLGNQPTYSGPVRMTFRV